MVKKSGLISRELLIVNAGGELPLSTLEAIREKKFNLRVLQDIDLLESALPAMQDPILLVECGDDSRRTEKVVKQILTEYAELRLPIVFVGQGAGRFESVLERTFPAAATLATPYGTAEVLAALNYIYDNHVQRKAKIVSGAIRRSLAVDGEKKQKASKAAPPPVVLTQKTVPEVVFAQLQRLDLFGRNLGGAVYAAGTVDINFMRLGQMLPSDPSFLDAIQELSVDAGRWGRLHLARTAYIAQRILEPMDPSPELREDVKSAAFLFAQSFAGDNVELLKRPLFDLRSQNARRELGLKVAESAEIVTNTMKRESTARVLKELSRLLLKEIPTQENDLSITASAVMAADFTDRVCYQSGSYDPRRAYVYLNRLKQGQITDFHPAVLACIVKFLAEALAGTTLIVSLPRPLRFDRVAQQELIQESKAPVPIGEQRLPVSALAPGMRLSQPLTAMDGREILEPDLVLDEDLIWRIWQLSAIRPLKSAVVFKG